MRAVNAGLLLVLNDIAAERERQKAKFPEHEGFDLPDGTDHGFAWAANRARDACDEAAKQNVVTWRHILMEEAAEAAAETERAALRKELIQVAAVCAKWVEAIDRRKPIAEEAA